MTGLVLIMGVQRSGTNALFKSLSSDASVLGVNESPDSAFFVELLLRPEPQLRPHLLAHDGVVVLKPISETNHRGVDALLDELSAYDPRVAWIYRDPVNCFHSHIERWTGFRDRPDAFAQHWTRRNALALAALSSRRDRMAIVRYEDLVTDPQVFTGLATWLGVTGAYLFRADHGRGRATQPAPVQQIIDAGTAQARQALDRARTFRAGEAGALTRTSARLAGRLKRQWGKLHRP